MRRNPAAQTKRYRHLVTLYRERPEHYLTLRECVSPEFLSLYLKDSVNLGFGDQDLVRRRADVAVELSDKIDDPHLKIQALISLASFYRNKGDRDQVIEILFKTEKLSEGCSCCLSFIFHMAGVTFHHFKEDDDISLLCFNEAIFHAKQICNEGQVAKVLVSRGYHIFHVSGDSNQALRDLKHAQEFLPKDAPSIYTIAILVNTASVLQATGGNDNFAEAKLVLANAREWLKGLPDLGLLRYIVTWIDGHLKIKTGERTEGIVLLNRAADGFKKMELENYYLAVQADLAKIYLQKRTFYAIRRLFKSKVQFLTEESHKLIERIRDTVKREDESTLRDLLNEMRQAQDVMIPELV